MEARRIWRDHEGKVVFWQSPNIWLIIWAFAEVAVFVLRSGRIERSLHWVGTGALIVWALLEIFQGVNYFRRALGLAVLILTSVSIFGAIF